MPATITGFLSHSWCLKNQIQEDILIPEVSNKAHFLWNDSMCAHVPATQCTAHMHVCDCKYLLFTIRMHKYMIKLGTKMWGLQ